MFRVYHRFMIMMIMLMMFGRCGHFNDDITARWLPPPVAHAQAALQILVFATAAATSAAGNCHAILLRFAELVEGR